MKNIIVTFIILISTMILFSDWSFDQRVFNGDGSEYFGHSVSISGDFAIVGSFSNEAYLYQKINDQWSEEQIIQPPDSTMYFGASVFINGDYMIIGDNQEYCNSSGSAVIYYYDEENWIEMDIISASSSPICDQYACSVGISPSGDYVIVGAANDDENAESAGAAYLYQRTDSQWTLQSKMMAYDGASSDWFGYSTYITDTFLFISAPLDDDNGNESGSIYVYENNGTDWVFHSKLTASHIASSDQFGYSISVSDNTLIAGTRCFDQGEAYIFNFDGSNWTEEAILTASDGFDYDHFGCSVSISGDFVVVGACDVPDVAMSASAYFYNRQDTEWVEQNKLINENWGGFGSAVSISGTNAIIGSEYDYSIEDYIGAAYLISYIDTSIDPELITSPDCNMVNNFPNPFNPSTTISFSLQNDASIELLIYNLKGQKIKTLNSGNYLKGTHSILWNGKNNSDNPVSSGIYLYKLEVNGKTEARNKCLLLK
ncbi:MAG: T9SS type A sorting domain-containing protein [Candidatus Cloacimonetes bacterium]|nr:T9SS type A sorting domain-containing protein [Candidatus Cloacimonadota bacterium]